MDGAEKTAFIVAMYQLGLGRDPEPGPALQAWAVQIKDDGSNRWQVAAGILGSPEGKHYRATNAQLRANLEAQAAAVKALSTL